MEMFKRRRIVLGAGGAALALSGVGGWAQQPFPNKPIRMVIPFPPGGGTDNVARPLADDLSKEFDQPTILDYRGGANGVIGTDAVARSAPDGHTLLLASIFSHVINQYIVKKLPYDVVNDFAPVTQINTVPLMIVVHPSLPVHSVAELVRYAKERPGQLSYASYGTGSQPHIAGEMFKLMGGIDMLHVPYKGGAAAIVDTLGGQVPVNFTGISLGGKHVEAGKLRALAVTSRERSKLVPNIPAVSETPGFQDYEASVSFAVWAPARTPAPVIARLHAAIVKVIGTASFKENLLAKGFAPETIGNTPAQMAATIAGFVDKLPRIMQSAGLKPE